MTKRSNREVRAEIRPDRRLVLRPALGWPRPRLLTAAIAGLALALSPAHADDQTVSSSTPTAKPPTTPDPTLPAHYTHYTNGPASRDGIGRFYMGREIAHVMGHRGAAWLERPSREREERTDRLIAWLPLEADDVVVDLGAGTGYFSLPIARRVPEGRVLAVDLQPEMLAIVGEKAHAASITHIEPVRATERDPNLPEGTADLVLVVDAYHEFSYPREVMQGVVHSLRPGGRVVLVEYRAEDPSVPIKPLHKMSEQQARREMEAVGLRWRETMSDLPQQHVLVFEKPDEKTGEKTGRKPE